MDLNSLERGIEERWLRAMRCGNFHAAWRESDLALELRKIFPNLQDGRPLHLRDVWDGSPIDGRVLLIRCHHGLGDSIHFVRFCKLAHARAAKVILKVQSELLPLFSQVEGVDQMISLEDSDPVFDVEAEIMELPFILRASRNDIPQDYPYLKIAKSLSPISTDKMKIGICWRTGNFRPERSILFEDLAALDLPTNFEFYSLQRNVTTSEALVFDFANGPEAPDKIEDTATLMQQLDLVITVDTMVAHLAGALAIPVWNLLHHDPDWRWMSFGQKTHWYPTMRLFRQVEPGDWRSVLNRVSESLATSANCPIL